LNINNLKKALISELKPKWNIENDNDLIESYCVMCSILGNDFIPHILNLNIKSGGLDKLISITETAIKNNGSLVENNKINQLTLSEIFNQIAETEDNDIISGVNKEIERKPRDFTLASQEFAIKNENILYKNDIVYLRELVNQLLSEYPVTIQDSKYIQKIVEENAQKLLYIHYIVL
jgi:5'-3' exonuclease